MPGALVAEHGRRVAGRVGARRRVHVGVADAARLEAHEHLARLRLGQVDLGHVQRLTELLEHRGANLHLDGSSLAICGAETYRDSIAIRIPRAIRIEPLIRSSARARRLSSNARFARLTSSDSAV